MNNAVRSSLDEDVVRSFERLRGSARRAQRRVDDRPRERHQQRRRDALARDIGDHHTQRLSTPAEPEQLEEIAADLAGRLVVAGQVVSVDVRGEQRHDGSLLAATECQIRVERRIRRRLPPPRPPPRRAVPRLTASASIAALTGGSAAGDPVAISRPSQRPLVAQSRGSRWARPRGGVSEDAARTRPPASSTTTVSAGAAAAKGARISRIRSASRRPGRSVEGHRRRGGSIQIRGERAFSIGVDAEEAIEPGALQDLGDGRLGPAQLDGGLDVAVLDAPCHLAHGAPAVLRVRWLLAVHHLHDRVEGDEARAGDERQVGKVDQQVACPRRRRDRGRHRRVAGNWRRRARRPAPSR